MPVEIKELIVRVAVTEVGNASGGASTSTGGASGAQMTQTSDACVEKIIQILKDKKER